MDFGEFLRGVALHHKVVKCKRPVEARLDLTEEGLAARETFVGERTSGLAEKVLALGFGSRNSRYCSAGNVK
jgi:hypothetical protein